VNWEKNMASLPIPLLKRTRPKTILLLYTLLIAVLAAALLLRSGSVAGRPTQPIHSGSGSPNLPPPVEVRRGTLKTYLILDGELRAVRSRTVFANISEQAKITYLAPEGSIVKPGDRLVELDSTTIVDKIKDIE
jgi:multidrug efflux pump subunit AcrA (membrane-fusion protein)